MSRPVVLADPAVPGVTRVAESDALPRPHIGVMGAIHGNERCGLGAIERLLAAFASGALAIPKGTLVLIHGNPEATAVGERHGAGGTDLNRLFDYSFKNSLAPERWTYEHHRAAALEPVLGDLDALLDLHSATAPTPPLGIVNTVAASLELAKRLGLPFVSTGWDAPGLIVNCVSIGALGRLGRPGVAVECGTHDDAASVDVAEACARRFLQALGVLDGPPPAIDDHVVHVRMAAALVRPSASFRFARPLASLERLSAGDVIGYDELSELRVRTDCRAVLPYEKAEVGQHIVYLAVDA